MALTNTQLEDLAKRMKIQLERVCFKDDLDDEPLKYNVAYIINMENEKDENGEPNLGTHWTCFYVKKLPNKTVEPIYMDSFGMPPPIEVTKYTGFKHVPYNTVDIQSLCDNVCGFYCLAFLQYISVFQQRTQILYTDCEDWTYLFKDLNKCNDYQHNIAMLKSFFESSDPAERARNPIDFNEGKVFTPNK